MAAFGLSRCFAKKWFVSVPFYLCLQHANADDVTKQMAKRQAGKVQGTDADLRRMTTAQARERLRCALLTCLALLFHAKNGRPSSPQLIHFCSYESETLTILLLLDSFPQELRTD